MNLRGKTSPLPFRAYLFFIELIHKAERSFIAKNPPILPQRVKEVSYDTEESWTPSKDNVQWITSTLFIYSIYGLKMSNFQINIASSSESFWRVGWANARIRECKILWACLWFYEFGNKSYSFQFIFEVSREKLVGSWQDGIQGMDNFTCRKMINPT